MDTSREIIASRNISRSRFVSMVYRNIPEGYASRVPGFAENLRTIREHLGLTQGELASGCGLSQDQISLWEGAKRRPDVVSALKLAVGLTMPLDRLFYGESPDYDLICHAMGAPSSASTEGGSPNHVDAKDRELQAVRQEFIRYRAAVGDLREAAEKILSLDAQAKRRAEGRRSSAPKPRRGRSHRKAG